MLKRFIPILLLTVMALSACSMQSGAQTGQASAPPESSVSSIPSQTEPGADEDSGEESSVKGTVVDASMHMMQIETDDGTSYLFGFDDVEIEAGGEGVVLGVTATIYFVGELDAGQDMQPVEVKRIVIS